MQISGAKKLIDDRGGYRVVAEALGWPLTTVHTFHRSDQAPDYRWNAIKALPKQAKREDRRQPRKAA